MKIFAMEAMMKRYTREERRQHIENWKAGPSSKTAYAKSAGIPPTTFCAWTHGRSSGNPGFVEIGKEKMAGHTQDITIERGGMVIRVPLSAGTEELQKVFAALGGPK